MIKSSLYPSFDQSAEFCYCLFFWLEDDRCSSSG